MSNRSEPYVKVTEVIKESPALLDIDGTSNVGVVIVSEVGPDIAYIQGPNQFLNTFTSNGEVPRNAHISFINAYYLSFSCGLIVARSMNTTAVDGLMFFKTSTSPVGVYYKEDVFLSKQTQLTFTVQDTSIPNWSFVLNGKVFYKGTYDPTLYAAFDEFIECTNELNPLLDVLSEVTQWSDCIGVGVTGPDDPEDYGETGVTGAPDYLTTVHGDYVEFTTDETSGTPLNVNIEVVIGELFDSYSVPTGDQIAFTLRSTTPQSSDTFKAQVTHIIDDDEGFELKISEPDPESTTGGLITNTYLVSLFRDALDSSGARIFIEYLNTLGIDFSVEVFTEDIIPAELSAGVSFGDSLLNLTECATPVNLIRALYKLEDQELYDISYLAPVGITNLQFLKAYFTVGKANKWLTPSDVPYDRTNSNSISNYFSAVDISDNIYCVGPFDKNSTLTGWINYIASSTLYYESVMRNKSVNSEFAPVFSNVTGAVSMTNPVKLLGTTEREKLLSLGAPVNYVTFSQRDGIYYFNNNLTHQISDNIMSEEQNRRLGNKISRDIKKIMKQFIGKYNTNSLREKVISVLNYYFSTNIMNQNYPPDAYEIICNEVNNTAQVINSNQLALTVKVRMYRSIKYVIVVNEIYPLGVDFTS